MEIREKESRLDGKPQDIRVYINSGRQRHQRGRIVTILSNLMASTCVLSSKTFNFHWNAGGEINLNLRTFFKKQAEELFSAVGTIAARIRMLGWEIPETKHLNSNPGFNPEIEDFSSLMGEFIRNHENVASFIQSNIQYVMEAGDEPTLILLDERKRKHEEHAAALREFQVKPETQDHPHIFRDGHNELVLINLA